MKLSLFGQQVPTDLPKAIRFSGEDFPTQSSKSPWVFFFTVSPALKVLELLFS